MLGGGDTDGTRGRTGRRVMRGADIIIPLYKNSCVIRYFVESILGAADDFRSLNARIVFIDDSEGNDKQADAVAAHLPRIKDICDVSVLVNQQSLGFARCCNRGLEVASRNGRDAVLLHSDAFVTSGALVEMAAVSELDPIIGFVSPRSNNATCNSHYPEQQHHSLGMNETARTHEQIKAYLPRVTYLPTAVDFCLYIRNLMLVEFGLLDEAYERGYSAEQDFIMRCNRRGYRTVLANHAFVYHAGTASFSHSHLRRQEEANRKILLRRYPEYSKTIERFLHSIEFEAQRLVLGFVPDARGRYRMLFECSNLRTLYNG